MHLQITWIDDSWIRNKFDNSFLMYRIRNGQNIKHPAVDAPYVTNDLYKVHLNGIRYCDINHKLLHLRPRLLTLFLRG